MATDKKILGDKGEFKAVLFLRKKGYEIVSTNFRIGRAEIDIIAHIGDQLVFVEVKTLQSIEYGFPEVAVDKRKEKMLLDAADRYCIENPETKGIRLDIISVIIKGNTTEIRHFEDAIFHWDD